MGHHRLQGNEGQGWRLAPHPGHLKRTSMPTVTHSKLGSSIRAASILNLSATLFPNKVEFTTDLKPVIPWGWKHLLTQKFCENKKKIHLKSLVTLISEGYKVPPCQGGTAQTQRPHRRSLWELNRGTLEVNRGKEWEENFQKTSYVNRKISFPKKVSKCKTGKPNENMKPATVTAARTHNSRGERGLKM